MKHRMVYKVCSALMGILCLSTFLLLESSVACIVVPEPQIGKVKTNVGKSTWTQQTWDDWQYDTYEETRGSLDTNNVAHAYADVNSGEIKLTVRRDSSDSTQFQNVWHGCSPSWASGAFYDAFSFSEAVDAQSVVVHLQYDGAFEVGQGSLSSFEIALWGDEGESTLSVDSSDTPSGCFSVPLVDIASLNSDGTYNLGLAVCLEAAGYFALAEYGNTFSLSFVSNDAGEDWTVSGTGFDEVPVGASVPIPSAILLLGGGVAGLLGLKQRQAHEVRPM
ncbi:MAG: hypothetical protein SWE60_25710 [Thermodesulfobacteriota bacterium]|nr:hypothetical protein [Thermodesulfobacteriota bacterium]